MLRWSVSAALLAIGAAVWVNAYLLRADIVALSILTGIASTSTASGAVDLIGLIERRHRELPLRQLAARRIGRANQLVLEIVQTMFADLAVESATAWPATLRAAPEAPVDLTEPARVVPTRPRTQYIVELLADLDRAMDELRALAAAGVLVSETNVLDTKLRGPFLAAVRVGTVCPQFRNRHVIALDAANLLDDVQALLPAARRAAGHTWVWGTD